VALARKFRKMSIFFRVLGFFTVLFGLFAISASYDNLKVRESGGRVKNRDRQYMLKNLLKSKKPSSLEVMAKPSTLMY